MRKIGKILGYTLLALCVLVLGLMAAGYFMVRGSLPITSGERRIPGLSQRVIVKRDAHGIPTIQGVNRLDVARATGFVHAQDRLFQMDLLRRNASGELSELLGPATLDADKQNRLHGFRKLSRHIVETMSPEDKEILIAYSEGVNAGMKALSVVPFEYLLTGSTPAEWTPEDSILVGMGLYFELQDATGTTKLSKICMQNNLPKDVHEFLLKNGSAWEAALDGSRLPIKDIPPKESFAYIREGSGKIAETQKKSEIKLGGSNHWVVDGRYTSNEKPLLACDMHLGLLVPNIWYRAAFVYQDQDGKEVRVDGVTLPGTPLMAVASNSHVAWGFTNAYLDTDDVIPVTNDPNDNARYLSESGPKSFEIRTEVIKVKGQDPVEYPITLSEWGPVLPEKIMDRAWAFKWVAHLPESFNMKLIGLEKTRDLPEALEVISEAKMPVLNCVLADKNGQIAWSFVGYIPRRTNSSAIWDKGLPKEQYPKIQNPGDGILWTANNRCLGGVWEDRFFAEGNGIRAYQIKKNLHKLDKATPQDMLAIQLDDEALFFERWQQLLMEVLSSDIALKDPRKKELRAVVENWGRRSSTDSTGYYFVRTFRTQVMKGILARVLRPCYEAWNGFNSRFDFEEPVWMIVSKRPEYLVHPDYETWENELLAYVDAMLDSPEVKQGSVRKMTWGKVNTLRIQHPLSMAVPFLSTWLDMPNEPVSGDYFMPKLTSPNEGASQRFVVSPGNEAEGIMHMPCGQSGHPLSPHYRDGQAAWVNGEATPLLPGEAKHTLVLTP